MFEIFGSFVMFITSIVLFLLLLIGSERNESTMSSFIVFGIGFIVMIIGIIIYGYKNADKKDLEINSYERASTALRFLVFWPVTIINFIFSDVIVFIVEIFEKITSKMLSSLFNFGKNLKKNK